jgi:hypothetical protein
VRYLRIEASSGCTHFELSNAPGPPATIDFPALRFETIPITDDCNFCFDSGKYLGKDAAAGEREMRELAIRTFIRAESDTKTICWSAVNDFEYERSHHNFFSSDGFAAAWNAGHAFRISLKLTCEASCTIILLVLLGPRPMVRRHFRLS